MTAPYNGIGEGRACVCARSAHGCDAAQALADSVDELVKGLGPSAPRLALHMHT